MATKIKIGHASISEKGTAYGEAGDQTGSEVCIKENFTIIGTDSSLYPTVVLRPNTSSLAKASAAACEAGCANSNIGYSQTGRNSLYEYAKNTNFDLAKINTACNTDCSAFMTVCAIAGGSKISYGSNAPTTTNMRSRFKQSGDYTVLTSSKYLTQTDYLKRGDILVCEGSHTVMVLENGSSYATEADESDMGGITTLTDIRIRHINVMVDTVETTKAVINIKLSEIKAGTPNKALGAGVIAKYDWLYILTALDGTRNSTASLSFDTSNKGLSLTNLKAQTTYTIQVFAKNKKTGDIEFCSQKVLFTTLATMTTTGNTKQEFIGKATNAINHIYVKVNDEFKPIIIYNNINEVSK